MVLVDTSVWVEHFRRGEPLLEKMLLRASVLTHPFVIGELACGTLGNRSEVLRNLALLPSATIATDEEVLDLVEKHKLWGRGVGWVDMHLMASALLSSCPMWTMDQKLNATAERAAVSCFR